jgi:hypothetical protein
MASNHGWRRDERGRRRETCSPYAQAHVWTAWRGSACAAGQRLPGEDFTTAPPGAPHLALPPACTHTTTTSVMHSVHQEEVRRGVELGGDRAANTQVGSSHGSPRRGSGRRIYSVEEEEGAERSISPKVAAAESAGGSQNRRATARRLGLRRSQSTGKRGVRERG